MQSRSFFTRVILLVSCSSLALVGCASPIKIAHDMDPEVDFSKFKTFAWISDEPLIKPAEGLTAGAGARVNPLDDQRVRRAVNQNLSSKGFKPVGLEQADLVVSYGFGSEEKLDIYSSPNAGGYYPYGYGYGYGYGGWYGGSDVRVNQYTQGTLTIQLFDRETKNAVWVGWASKRLSDSDSRKEGLLAEVINKILEPFPPGAPAPAK